MPSSSSSSSLGAKVVLRRSGRPQTSTAWPRPRWPSWSRDARSLGRCSRPRSRWKRRSSRAWMSHLVACLPTYETSTPGASVRRPCWARCACRCAPSSVAGVGPLSGLMIITWASRRWGTSPTTSVRSTRLWLPNGRIAWPTSAANGARGWPGARVGLRASSTAPPRTSSRGRPSARGRRPPPWGMRGGRAMRRRTCGGRWPWMG